MAPYIDQWQWTYWLKGSNNKSFHFGRAEDERLITVNVLMEDILRNPLKQFIRIIFFIPTHSELKHSLPKLSSIPTMQCVEIMRQNRKKIKHKTKKKQSFKCALNHQQVVHMSDIFYLSKWHQNHPILPTLPNTTFSWRGLSRRFLVAI